MPFELIILFSSMILYSMKCHRLNSYKINYEKSYNLDRIVICN